MVEYVSEKGALILEKDNKLIENLASAITELYRDDDRKEAMSEAGMKRAEVFSEINFYNNFVSVVLE